MPTKAKPFTNALIHVTLIAVHGQSALVQWMNDKGEYARVYIPEQELKGMDMDEGTALATPEVLTAGIPFGYAFETLPLGKTATAATIANSLRARGIWTLEDVRAHQLEIRAALADAYTTDLRILLEASRQPRASAE